MNPKSYETLAGHHIDSIRREASGTHQLALMKGRRANRRPIWRGLVDRLASVRHRVEVDLVRSGRDLRPPRGGLRGQDVLDVRAGRLQGDSK
jgi:hypothetical protein